MEDHVTCGSLIGFFFYFKLDAGLDEKMMLMSRDEQSCLIVSYKEVKNCIIAAFKDLTSGRK